MDVKKQKVPQIPIEDEKVSKVKMSKNELQVKTFDKEIKPPDYRKTKGNVWENPKTGERKKAKLRDEEDLRSTGSLNNTFKNLRDVICFNFNGDKSEIFVTLTTGELKSIDEINRMFDNFWDRWTRHFKNIPMRCLMVIEPTDWDKYHLHCIIKRLDDKKFYVKKDIVSELWGYGIVKVKSVYDKRGIGWYLSTLYVSKKKKNLKYYRQKFQIYHRRGKFEKIDKLDMKHGDVYNFAEDNNYILDESARFELIEEESGEILNGVTEEYFSRKK